MNTGEQEMRAKEQIIRICEQIGYGRVMQIASTAWVMVDPLGALTVGPATAQVNDLEDRLEVAERKAELADEVLGDDDHLHVAEESPGVWYEFCEYCPSIQREIDNYKPRPFPHDPDCPKARYDALSA